MSTNTSLSLPEMMAIRNIATLIEISGGQPLDRIKMNLQLPKSQRISFKNLIKMGPKEFYSASLTSIVQRCIFYIPSIYFLGDYYDNNLSSRYKNNITENKNDEILTYDNLVKPLFISTFVFPHVAIFESLKADQQIKNIRNVNLTRHMINKYKMYGIRGVLPSTTATFLRESLFSAGICVFIPVYYNKLNNYSNSYSNSYSNINSYNTILAGIGAGITTQVISQPFDTIKTRQEYDCRYNFYQTSKHIYNQQGLKGFFCGLIPRVGRGMWTLGCLSYVTTHLTNFLEK